jgi:menaquinone-9 beta-reductase
MKNITENFKTIIIIGAGPAGCLSAYLLAQNGFKVSIIDKAVEAKRKICGEYLCPSGVDILNELNLSEKVSAQFNQLYGMKIVSPAQRSFTSFFPGKAYGISVNRQEFDQSLRDLISSQNNITTYFGETFLNVEKNNNNWTVKTDNHEISADLIIGADGVHSRLSKILSHQNKVNSNRIALHVYLKVKAPKFYTRVGQMHIFDDGEYCGLDPIHADEINFSIVCDKKMLQKYKAHELINHYISKSKCLSLMFDTISENERITSIYPLTSRNSHIAGDGIAYVGDAAGFFDPLTGEGIYNALLSAKLLSTSICTDPTNAGLAIYKRNKLSVNREKALLNKGFQFIIKFKFLCEIISWYLRRSQSRADSFIGIIGNIYTPFQGLKKILFS